MNQLMFTSLCLAFFINELKWRKKSNFLVDFTALLVSLEYLRISERKVKHHLGGSDFEICKSINSWKSFIAADCSGARNYKSHKIRKIRPKQIEYYSGLAYSCTF